MTDSSDEPAIALSFFDAARGLHGTIRSGLTLLFDGRQARAEHAAAELERTVDGWRGRAGAGVDVTLTPTSEVADLAGVSIGICSVEGRVGDEKIAGLGTAAETRRAPEWPKLDSLRAVSAVFDPGLAALAIARRPRAAQGHGQELVTAALVEAGQPRAPEDARISTVYDGGGRQHSSGIELWFPGEDYPRRLFGTVQAGTSLQLENLVVHAAVFAWRMEGHTGAGMYELTVREDQAEPAAAA